MGNVLSNFLGFLKVGEEEEYDEFLEEEENSEKKRAKRSSRADYEDETEDQNSYSGREARTERSNVSSISSVPRRSWEEGESLRERRNTRTDRTASGKVVPIRTTMKGMEVCIMKPASFNDSQDICDMLLTGRAVVVNLEGFEPLAAQRIMDFISGAVYAINGKLHQISKYIFIFSPDNIDISGDDMGFSADDESFEVPTLNKEF